MLKKSIASLVLSMVMLASGSVFSFSDTGVKNHADGKDCPGFYQSDSFSTYSGGWTQTNSTDKSGNHWTKRTVRNGNQYFCKRCKWWGICWSTKSYEFLCQIKSNC